MDETPRDKPVERDTLISKEENLAMFNQIARRYDGMNRLISLGLDRGWRKSAVTLLFDRTRTRVLDLGCGTADLALDVARAEDSSRIVGLDPSLGMLREGVRKVDAADFRSRIDFGVGDATALPFSDASFDGIVLGFVIRNVAQRMRALLEMGRVLMPGGRLVILELGVPENRFFSFFHHLHTRTLVPVAARLFAEKGAYDYLIRSVEAFPAPRRFVEEMRSAGFSNAGFSPLTLGAVNLFYGDVDKRV